MIDHLPPPIINIVIIIRRSVLPHTSGSCPSSAGCIIHSLERERACREAPSSVYQYWAGRGMKTEWMSGQKKPLEHEEEHCTCVQRYIDTATTSHQAARTALSAHQMLQTDCRLFYDSCSSHFYLLPVRSFKFDICLFQLTLTPCSWWPMFD